ncbi:hypothetical protein NADFUDRAFT_70788 [Nadsonia fulvescens var. elongata DSM 6958]|uniref:Uncharacterized protein n=1 Tax=Nadsonia fulvescens var. elongata DSM 6958 TaxID=857566 RepID=A0A1E3PJB4_9ASCO|nr:hypothetical protein NADFUDRAFT_70788 [Nadsonia fulvescens var. elongata DSM 6958]
MSSMSLSSSYLSLRELPSGTQPSSLTISTARSPASSALALTATPQTNRMTSALDLDIQTRLSQAIAKVLQTHKRDYEKSDCSDDDEDTSMTEACIERGTKPEAELIHFNSQRQKRQQHPQTQRYRVNSQPAKSSLINDPVHLNGLKLPTSLLNPTGGESSSSRDGPWVFVYAPSSPSSHELYESLISVCESFSPSVWVQLRILGEVNSDIKPSGKSPHLALTQGQSQSIQTGRILGILHPLGGGRQLLPAVVILDHQFRKRVMLPLGVANSTVRLGKVCKPFDPRRDDVPHIVKDSVGYLIWEQSVKNTKI